MTDTPPPALGEDTERWLADQPVLAYPEPIPARAMRWVRRRKQWVAAAAAMLILTVLGLAIHDWRITREKGRTTDQLAMTRDALRDSSRSRGKTWPSFPIPRSCANTSLSSSSIAINNWAINSRPTRASGSKRRRCFA